MKKSMSGSKEGTGGAAPSQLMDDPKFGLADILKGSDYALTVFTKSEIDTIELFAKNGKPYLTCRCTDKARPAKPEEIVRQLYSRS